MPLVPNQKLLSTGLLVWIWVALLSPASRAFASSQTERPSHDPLPVCPLLLAPWLHAPEINHKRMVLLALILHRDGQTAERAVSTAQILNDMGTLMPIYGTRPRSQAWSVIFQNLRQTSWVGFDAPERNGGISPGYRYFITAEGEATFKQALLASQRQYHARRSVQERRIAEPVPRDLHALPEMEWIEFRVLSELSHEKPISTSEILAALEHEGYRGHGGSGLRRILNLLTQNGWVLGSFRGTSRLYTLTREGMGELRYFHDFYRHLARFAQPIGVYPATHRYER